MSSGQNRHPSEVRALGVSLTVVMGLQKSGATPTNVGEYLDTNSKFIDHNVLDQMRPSLQSKLP